jgi:hypothetical protein
VCAFIAFLPIPGARLIAPDGYSLIDIHSHTKASRDALVSAEGSLRYFRAHGYDAFFITEHSNVSGFPRFKEEERFRTVFPGVQIRTSDGVSVLVLAESEFDVSGFRGLHLSELIERTMEEGMLVIIPHWWAKATFTFEELRDMGINGFEVYNLGYRNLGRNKFTELVKFCEDNDLMMFASTDFHGWGYTTDAWTAVKGDARGNLFNLLNSKPEIKLVTNRREQGSSAIRFIFDPAAWLYYYLKEASALNTIAFLAWVIIIYALASLKSFSKIMRFAPIPISAFFFCAIVYYYDMWLSVRELNNIIPTSVIPGLFVLGLAWYIIWLLRPTLKSCD